MPLVQGLTNKNFNGWELSADVDVYRYYLTVDVGHSALTEVSETETYENSGDYLRVGVDVNFLKKDPEKNMLFFGARYAVGNFSESLRGIIDDPLYGSVTQTFTNPDARARWFEITTGIRVYIWKFFWMGYTIRYKAGLKTYDTGNLVPHDIPGYGGTAKSTTWGFSYVLLFRIPLPD